MDAGACLLLAVLPYGCTVGFMCYPVVRRQGVLWIYREIGIVVLSDFQYICSQED